MALDVVAADDELLDRICSYGASDVELVQLLTAWRCSIREVPSGELVSVEEALEWLRGARWGRLRSVVLRWLAPKGA